MTEVEHATVVSLYKIIAYQMLTARLDKVKLNYDEVTAALDGYNLRFNLTDNDKEVQIELVKESQQ